MRATRAFARLTCVVAMSAARLTAVVYFIFSTPLFLLFDVNVDPFSASGRTYALLLTVAAGPGIFE